MNKKWIEKLETLLNIPSPSGDTEEAVSFVENEFKTLGIKTERTNKGALIATINGEDDENQITFSAHVDTLGLMVKEIKDNGTLKTAQIGGFAWTSVEGEYVTISTLEGKKYRGTVLSTKASRHIFSTETDTMTREQDNIEIRIDEKVKNAEDVEKLGINVGDFCYLDPRVEVTKSGFVKSRHLDDKAGVICLLAFSESLTKSKNKLKNTVNFLITNYEEVGHGATQVPPKTKILIAVDMANPGPGQQSDEFSCAICAKDSSGPYDLSLRKEFASLAKKHNIDIKHDIYNYYSSDGSCALRTGFDIKVGLIGPGVDASHGYERTHVDALDATVKLCEAFIK